MPTVIQKLEDQLRFLKEQREDIDEKIRVIEFALASSTPSEQATSIFVNTPISESLIRVLETELKWYAAMPLADRIREQGFNIARYRNLATYLAGVAVTLKRLAKNGRILIKHENGRHLYGPLSLLNT